MCYIIQVCCNDCKKFYNFKIYIGDDYINFIKNNFNEYEDYTYLIYDSGGILLNILDGYDLVG